MTLQQLEANLGLVFLGDLGAAQRIIDWVKAHNAVLANQDKQQLAQMTQERDKWNENHRVMCRVEHELRQQLATVQAELASHA